MADTAYRMAFTAGALLLRESVLAAELYARVGDWGAVRRELRTGKLLQIRTASAAERRGREVVQRLENLTPAQLSLLVAGERGEQAALVWLASCKRYRFIRDFATEIVREKFVRLDPHLTYDDFDIFFNRQAEWHAEVDRIEPSTRTKLRSTLFAMLREADILAAGDLIQPALLSPAVIRAIRADDPTQLAIFPVADAQLKEWNA
jgi:hypothetical protein